ncbi:MAG: T9SS type A sorting domain-containing protein [Bacteroidota bacterium]
MKRLSLLLFFYLITPGEALPLFAQTFGLEPAYPQVTRAGNTLPLAWFGGLNTPQPQAVDLDGDDVNDLLIFDKAGQLFLAAKGDGNGNYEEAPELVKYFPSEVEEWMLLRDYNLDGLPDMFHYSSDVDGVAVRRARRRTDGLLTFELIDFGDPLPLLYFPFERNRTSIFVSSIDYPAIFDVDFDGDLDLLTFSVAGGQVEYYKNMGVEQGLGADTLVFVLEDQCWGGFFESGITTALDLAPGPGDCFSNLLPPNGNGRPRHAGSSLLALDYDGNGLTDLILGDVSFRQLVLALNNGSREEAWISEQDTTWKTNDQIAQIPTFPAAFHLDVDQDGDRDIIGSPSTTLNGQDVEVMWFYANEGSDAAPDFQFQSSNFLTDRMLDLGTSANVTVFDADADGRPDLILGNNDEYTGTNLLDSRLRLLRNVTGDDGEIAFELVDEDYLGLSAFMTTSWAFAPTFGDLDDDGDLDVIIGERRGNLIFGENTAGPGNPATFAPFQFEWKNIDAGQFAKPFLSDLDRDGKLDLLVGGFDGRIRFYHNIGTKQEPEFDPDPLAEGNALQLGGINTNRPGVSTGHPSPWVLQYSNHTLVITGNRTGTLEVYRLGIDSSYTEAFTLLTQSADNLDVGGFSNPGFGDFDGDKELELVVGSQRGGVTFFYTSQSVDQTVGIFSPRLPDFAFRVFPNPTDQQITIAGWPRQGVSEISLLDVAGRLLRTTTINPAQTQVQWNLAEQAPGIYLVRVTGTAGASVKRVVVR